MKKFLLIIACLTLSPVSAFAAPGDSPGDQLSAIWRFAAGDYTTTVTTKMTAPANRIPGSTSIEKDAFAAWMQIDIAWNAKYNKVFPLSVFYRFLEYFEGYTYNSMRLVDTAIPPGSPTVTGSTITCFDDEINGTIRPYLFEWDDVSFTQVAINATKAAGVWTFASVPSGVYVIVYGEMESLPTVFLTVE